MTKKIFLGMSAMAMLFATSCQDDMNLPGNVGETTTVAFNVSTPEIGTRAYSDGQTATVLQYAVYDAQGNILPQLKKMDATIDIKANVELELTTGDTYTIIFWAEAPNAPYDVEFTDEIENSTMTVNYDGAVSNDENRDAFYAAHTFTVSGAQTENVQLRRPFAQLNIGTSDYTNAKNAGYEPKYSMVTVPVYTTLNLSTGEVNGQTTKEFTYNDIPTGERFPVTGYEYLAMNYLLVDAEQEVVDIEFGYTETDATAAKTRTVGSVPVQRNYRTNIYGKLLTSTVDVNVEIKPGFDEPANNLDQFVTSKADLKAQLETAIQNGETNIVLNALNENIGDLNYGITTTLVPEGVTVTLCNAIVEGRSYGNGVNGTIIFENCTFKNTGAYSIHFDNGKGNVIFKNCELYGWNSFGSSLNTVKFYDSKLFGNGTYALIRSYVDLTLENCYIDTTEANHEDAYSEGVEAISPATLTEKNVNYVVSNVAALQEAIQAGKDVVLLNDLTISAAEMLTAPYGNKMALSHNGGVFDGNGKTISATMGGDNYAVMTNGGTIKNLTIDNGFRGIVIMSATQTINLENVVSSGEGVCYALNTAEGTSTQDLVAKNCTFNGWSSWSLLKSAKFTNCEFGQGTYYTNVYGRLGKPYVNTLFDGCNFCSKYYIDLSALGADQKVTLKNCTVNGVKITAENWTSLVAPEDTCGEGQISVELKNGTYLTAENVADYIVFE